MLLTEQITRLEKQLSYANNVLNNGGLAAWEAKEYSNLIEQYNNELETLKSQLAANIHLF